MNRPGRGSKGGGSRKGDSSGLGNVLSSMIGGDADMGKPGGENPAFNAKGPEDVKYSYKGDPSQAIDTLGTSNATVPLGFWGRLFNPSKSAAIDQSNLAARVANQNADIQV